MAKTFTKFTQLPSELRTAIWDLAIPVAHDREVHVAVYYRPLLTMHSCYVETGQFCGRHGRCDGFVHDGRPRETAVCMTDGYFALSPDFPDLDRAFQRKLYNLLLACHESFHRVQLQYPQAVKVYREKWHAGVAVRTVRCNPANDVLVIMNAFSQTSRHIQPGLEGLVSLDDLRQTHDRQERQFPQDRQKFRDFREVLSTFRKVAFRHVELDALLDVAADDLEDQQDPQPPVSSPDIMILSLHMESRESVYLWLDPDSFPEIQIAGQTRIDDISIFSEMHSTQAKDASDDAAEMVDSYRITVRAARDHCAEDEEHWTPKPKDMDRIGSYIPISWLSFFN